jgi:hypothetical protein
MVFGREPDEDEAEKVAESKARFFGSLMGELGSVVNAA